MPPSPVSVSTSTKRIVIMNSSRNPRRAWGPGKTPSASNEEVKHEETSDVIKAVVKKYAEAGDADKKAESTDEVKTDEETGKTQSQPNSAKKLINPNEQNGQKKPIGTNRNNPVLQQQNKENQESRQISENILEEISSLKVEDRNQPSVSQQNDTAPPPVHNRTKQFARSSKQLPHNGVSHSHNNVQKNFVPSASQPKTNHNILQAQRGYNEACKPASPSKNKSFPSLPGNANERQFGPPKYGPPGFPVAPPGFRYPPLTFHGARPRFGNDQRGGSPHGSQGSGGSNDSPQERRMNAGNTPRGDAKVQNRRNRNTKKGAQTGQFEMNQKMESHLNHAPANLVEMSQMSQPPPQKFSIVSPPMYAPGANYIQQVPNSMGHMHPMGQRMPPHVVHPVATMQPVFVDQEYNVAYYQGPNFVQQPWLGVVADGQNFVPYGSGAETVQIQNSPGAPYSVQYMTAPIVPYTAGVPVFAAPVQNQPITVSSSVGPITASTEAPNQHIPLSQLERSWEGGHPSPQEQHSCPAPAANRSSADTPTSRPLPPSTPIESTTNSPASKLPDERRSSPTQPPVSEDESAAAAPSPSPAEGPVHQGRPLRAKGAPQKLNMLSVTALERSQRMSSANGKRVPMNARNKDSPNHVPPAPPDVQEEVIKFICDSWNKVYQEHLNDSSAVAYHVESCPLPEGFVPFDLEAYWGKRLVQNMTTQNIPTQNM